MKKVSLKKGLELLGFKNIKVEKGYNFRCGFMEKDGQIYYFSTRDLRDYSQRDAHFLMIREVRDRKDYTGCGINKYYAVEQLADMDYFLDIPFCSCDVNIG